MATAATAHPSDKRMDRTPAHGRRLKNPVCHGLLRGASDELSIVCTSGLSVTLAGLYFIDELWPLIMGSMRSEARCKGVLVSWCKRPAARRFEGCSKDVPSQSQPGAVDLRAFLQHFSFSASDDLVSSNLVVWPLERAPSH